MILNNWLLSSTVRSEANVSPAGIYTWGYGEIGGMGQGNTVNQHSPTKIGLNSWTQISIGLQHVLALRSDGGLFAWGSGTNGQLGISLSANRSSPVQIGAQSWLNVTAGALHSAAIHSNGSLFTWGNATIGELGDGTTVNKNSPVKIGNDSWKQVASDSDVFGTVAIRQDGTLWGWGQSFIATAAEQTATFSPATVQTSSPVLISSLNWKEVTLGGGHFLGLLANGDMYTFGTIGTPGNYWTDLATGTAFTIGVRSDGSLWSWGRNLEGQLGDSSQQNRSSPVKIGNSSWSSVAAAFSTAYAIRSDGALFAWGRSDLGQIGDGLTSRSIFDSVVQSPSVTYSWRELVGSSNRTAGLTSDGALWVWGANEAGQIGNGTTINRSSPVKIGTGSWTHVSIGANTTAAIAANGALYTWGSNAFGKLGSGELFILTGRSSPVQVGTSSWIDVSSSSNNHSVAIRSDGTLWAWGDNLTYQLGQGKVTIEYSNVLQDVSMVAPGFNHHALITNNGAMYVWGLNSSGQIGDGTSLNKSSPVQVGTGSSWINVAVGTNVTYAIRSDGGLFTWGSGASGALGDGTTINKSSPVKIGSQSWSQISLHKQHALAVHANGALYAWGLNSSGQIGDGTTINRSSPVQIGALSWTQISAGASHSAAIAANGALYTWGVNVGNIGDGTTLNRSSPVKIGASSWTKIAAHNGKTYGILWTGNEGSNTSNGPLFAWGTNLSGELGIGLTTNRSSPVQVGGQSPEFAFRSWSDVGFAAETAFAVQSDGANTGRLQVWGINTTGELGDTTLTSRSSPVIIPAYSQPSFGLVTEIPFTVKKLFSTADDGAYKFALLPNNVVYVWGGNAFGLIPNPRLPAQALYRSSPVSLGASNTIFAPIQVGSNSDWTRVTTGNAFTIATNTSNALFGWGSGASGSLGNQLGSVVSPTIINSTNNWVQISTGDSHAIAINSGGILYAWGNNQFGQLGLNLTTVDNFTQLQNTFVDVQVATGTFEAAYALDNQGRFWGWGNLGLEKSILDKIGWEFQTVFNSPILLLGSESYSTMAISRGRRALIHSNGSLYMWGAVVGNGENSFISRSSPVKIGTESWSKVAVSDDHTLAIHSNGSLYAWGNQLQGQLGNGINPGSNAITPQKIGASSWAAIAAGTSYSLGITIDGGIFGWGGGTNGETGLGFTTGRSSPVAVSGLSSTDGLNAIQLTANPGGSTSALILANGALYMWGLNGSGQLGDNTTTPKSAPLKIGASSWLKVSTGLSHTIGILSNNKLYAWGNNRIGGLGDGTTVTKSSPIQIGAGDWSANCLHAAVIQALNTMSFAANTTGHLFAWGDSRTGLHGRIQDGLILGRSSPVLVGQTVNILTTQSSVGSLGWSSVVAGAFHSTGLLSNGSLFTWGLNTGGQLGDGTTVNKSSPVKIGASSWSAIGAGNNATIAALSGVAAFPNMHTLFTWGLGAAGQLGDQLGSTANRSSPVQIGFNSFRPSPIQIGTLSWAKITAGSSFAVGTLANGQVYSWGFNNYGQLGDSTSGTVLVNKSSPVLTTSAIGKSWAQISAGGSFVTGIDANGYLYAWGGGDQGAIGNGTTTNAIVENPGSWSQVAAGWQGMAGIRANGSLFVWGTNVFTGSGINRSSPIQIGSGISFTKLSAKATHAGLIAQNGALYTFGTNNVGQLGNGATTEGTGTTYGVLNKIGAESWAQITAGGSYTLAIHSNGALYTWGLNNNGQLGDGTTVNKSSPVKIGSDSWISVSAGGSGNTNGAVQGGHSIAIRLDGGLFVWGRNVEGQIGDGTTVNKSSPVKIGSLSWNLISAGTLHSVGTLANGSMFTWGNNARNQLGDGTTVNKSSPVQIGTDINWTFVNASVGDGGPSWATAANGILYVWGQNGATTGGTALFGNGTTALATRITTPTPATLPTRHTTSWILISTAEQNVAAIDRFNDIYAWGDGATGQLGSGITLASKLLISPFGITSPANAWVTLWPYRVGDLSWSQTTAGLGSALGILANGAISSWGLNNVGQLGDSTTINKSSPVVLGTSSWSFINSGMRRFAAITTDGRLFAWGDNAVGSLGDGTTVTRSSPVSIGATTFDWWKVYPGRGAGGSENFSVMLSRSGTLFRTGENSSGELGDGTTL